uniref:B box-type domain-containing protein n=1 Tax=Globisporangium ultimum (strain ATCC 200006 / CBS 805.95 / DAOM BR144) TaxID=431595 RepID=K3X0C9_GLOUD
MLTSAYIAAGSVSDDAHAKSPFECSMTLIKICKTVGISLSTNTSSSSLSFWNSKQRDIDFESFCDFAIRNAIQPALQHFKMDKTVNEYVAMIDCIVENMITPSSSIPQLERTASDTGEGEYRTKELAEIHPLLPHWKIGITFLGKQKPVTRLGVNATIADPTSESQGEDTKRVVVAANLPCHREFAFPMPGNEAKATHDANIQRKVQLHKSWQPHSALANTSLNIVALQAVSEFPPFVSTPGVAERPMHTNSDSGRPIPTVLLGSQRSDAVAKHENQKCEAVTSDTADNNNHVIQNDETFAASQRAETPCADEEVLLCVECSQAEAVLWCASCFAVFCVHCWQTSHLLNVDMSSITEGSDCSTSMLAPMAKPLRANGTMNNQHVPVAMHYLATKPQATGKLAKGACSGDWKHRHEEPASVLRLDTLDTQHELPAVVSHAILPPLHKTSKPAKKDKHHPEYLESTSNLVKSLMLDATLLSSSSLSSHSSSSSPVPNVAPQGKYKDPLGKRPKLHPAAVFLDPNELFRDSCQPLRPRNVSQ